MADKQDTQNEQVRRIRHLVDETFALTHRAAFTVTLDDFGDWLTALDRTEFYVSRRDDTAELFVFWNGMYRGWYVSVHAIGATVVDGHDVPENEHIVLPAAEVVNVRAGVAVS